MAQRTSSFDCVVLRCRESPSGARIITLLSDEAGLVDAFVFGGPKSRLRSLASPWHEGRAWIYRDSAKDFVTLRDFDAIREFPSVRTSLDAISAASLAGEFIMATSALGGDWMDAKALFIDLIQTLDLLLAENPARLKGSIDRAVILFCVRAIQAMGLMPDPGECSSCAGAIRPDAVQSYSRRHGGFMCTACSAGATHGVARESGLIPLPTGALAWLAATEGMEFGQAVRTGLGAEAQAALKASVFDLLRKSAESPLRTLESGLL
jgi:DNA repair protein RecO (recombination protein O)